jgi:hypothetical protein
VAKTTLSTTFVLTTNNQLTEIKTKQLWYQNDPRSILHLNMFGLSVFAFFFPAKSGLKVHF